MNILYQIFSEDLIYALGWTVLHSLWQALAIGLLMAVGMLFLQQKSAKVRYEVASFSLFLMFVSSLVTFLVYYETAQVTSDFTAITLQTTGDAMNSGESMTVTATTLQTFMHYFNQHLPLVVMVWFLGACFFLLRLMGGLAYIQRIKYTNNKPAPDYWTDRLQKLCNKIRLRRSVKLVESSLATVPMVIGFLKPVILMPVGAINGLSESEVDAILAHELAHIHRNDFLINIFLSVIEVLFYFNPAVWWIAANVRTERENCCDDIAIQLCGSSLIYAKALLNLQEMSQSVPGYAMAFAGSKNQLLQRIKRILSQPRAKSNMVEKFTATCLLLVTVVLFSIGANSYNYNEMLQQQHFADEMNELMAEEQEDQALYFDLGTDADEEIPPKKKNNKQRYIKKSDGGEVEIEIEEGEISRLVIDGEEISEDELPGYNELIDDLIVEMEAVPKCLPTPPAPQHLNANLALTSPPAFVKKHKKTITTETEDNGQTRIVIHSNGEIPTEIIINDEQEFIFIDGTRLEGGDTAVIIDEKNTFSFPGNGNTNTFSFSPPDFSFEVDDFSFEIADFDNLSEEVKDAFRKSAASFEEVMALRKEEIQQMYNELKHQREELNHQLIQLHQHKMDQHVAKREQLADRHYRQKTNEGRKALEKTMDKEIQKAKVDVLKSERYNSEGVLEDPGERQLFDIMETLERQEEASFHFNNKIEIAIVKEMIKDGLIRDENNYFFELTTKFFSVNGKKQSVPITNKYLKIYENVNGRKLNTKAHIHYYNKDGRSNSRFRSSGIFHPGIEQKYTYYFFRGPETLPMNMVQPKQIEGLETLRIQLAPVKVVYDLIGTT